MGINIEINGNRPFPSSKKSHFQNEAQCETFVVKMSFICIIIKNHFHINGLALSLALKVRFFGTRKWPITLTWACCCFFCVTWAQFMAVLYGFTARCLFGVVFLHKAKQGK